MSKVYIKVFWHSTFESNNGFPNRNRLGVGGIIYAVPIQGVGPNLGTFVISADGESAGGGVEARGGGVAQKAGQRRGACHGLGHDRRYDGLLENRFCQLAAETVF